MVTSELHTFHLNWKNRNWVTTQRERRKSIKLPLLHCILHLPFGICLPKKQLLKGRKKTFNVYHVHTDLICLQREKANTTIFLSLEIGHKGFFFYRKVYPEALWRPQGKYWWATWGLNSIMLFSQESWGSELKCLVRQHFMFQEQKAGDTKAAGTNRKASPHRHWSLIFCRLLQTASSQEY